MIAAPHLIVGAILGDLIKNYPLAFLAGFASHFVFDAIPHLEFFHWLKNKNGKIRLPKKAIIFEFFEVSLGVGIVIWFWLSNYRCWSILIGAMAAILPDLIDNVPYWSSELRKGNGFRQFHQFHHLVHFSLKRKDWIFGLPVYIIIIGMFAWAIISKP